MQSANPALTAALALGQRSAAHVLRLGGRDVSSQVEGWSLDRAYATDLPDAVRAFSGSTSAQLSADVSGTGGSSAPALYGPWAPRSTGDVARPGQSVVQGWGLNGETLDTFRGTVRSRSAESGTDAVRVTALDGAERLRQPARLPYPDIPLKSVEPWTLNYTWVTSCTWIVDQLLRNAGIHTCPPPRSTSIFYAAMHGGAAPSIGALRDFKGLWNYWQKRAAPFESVADATYVTLEANYYPATATINRSLYGLWLEGWVNNSTGDQAKDQTVRYRLTYNTGSGYRYVALDANFYTGRLTASHGSNWDPALNQQVTWNFSMGPVGTFHLGWWLKWSSTGVPTMVPVITRPDKSVIVGGEGILGSTPSPPGELGSINLVLTNIRAEALQISWHAARPATDAERTLTGTWTKGATLGEPSFPMATFPRVSGDAWSVITEIARATLSTVEFDRDGFVRWRDYTRWATVPTQAQLTVSSARELASLAVTEEIDACRNDVTVKWQDWAGYDYELLGISDIPSQPITVQAQGLIRRAIPISEDRFDPLPPTLSDNFDGLGNLVIRSGALTTSPVVRGAAEFQVRRDGGTVYLTVYNRTNTTFVYHGCTMVAVRPATNTGSPVTALATERDTASQSAYGVQYYEHDGTPWIQYGGTATSVAKALLAASAFPSPQLQSVEVLPDPRIELGDVVRVVDTTGAQLDTLAWVVGIRTEGSGVSVRQTLTLRGAKSNGTPADSGLTPDPPTRPGAPPPT